MNEMFKCFEEGHAIRVVLLPSLYQDSPMQLVVHNRPALPRGFFMGHWHAELNWSQESRKEFKVYSRKKRLLVLDTASKFGLHPLP